MICVAYSKRTPCVGYMPRVGLKEQNDRIRQFASDNDIRIARFYEDRSDDYTSDNGYEELRKDGMKRKFDLVIFESLYRFGVTTAESSNLLLHTFYMLGIHFIIIEDGIDSRKESFDSLSVFLEEKKREISGCRSWATKVSSPKYGNLSNWKKEKKVVIHRELSEADKVFKVIRKRSSYIDPSEKLCVGDYGECRVKTTFVCLRNGYRELVTRDELIYEVIRAIKREKKMAQHVSQMLGTDEASEYMKTVEHNSRSKARTLFDDSAEVQKDNVRKYQMYQSGVITEEEYLEYRDHMLQKIKEISDEFSNLMTRLEYRRKHFSLENEWINRFIGIDVNNVSSELIKKTIVSVVIDEDGSVEVKLNTKGKEVFPRKWTTIRGDVHDT